MTTQQTLRLKGYIIQEKLEKFETVFFASKARWLCALSNSPLGLKKKRGRKVRSIFEFQIGQFNKNTVLTMMVKTYPYHLKNIDRGNKNRAQFYKLTQYLNL